MWKKWKTDSENHTTFRNEDNAKKAIGERECFIARTSLDVSWAFTPRLISH